jgi:hypothetical protein
MKDQVLYSQDEYASGVEKTFESSHLWSTHNPGNEMNTDGLTLQPYPLCTKNNGKTKLFGLFALGSSYPHYIYESTINGTGSLVYDSGLGTTIPSGFSTSFDVIYPYQQCIGWNPPSTDPSYNNTTTVVTGLTCDDLDNEESGRHTTTITYDEVAAEQRVVGCFYNTSSGQDPVLLIRETKKIGSDITIRDIYKDDLGNCVKTATYQSWDIEVNVKFSLKFKTHLVDGAEYTYSWAGNSVLDGDDVYISGSSGGSFLMPDVGINYVYSDTAGTSSYTYNGDIPVESKPTHVSVPGETGCFVFIGLAKDSQNIYGLAVARSEDATVIPYPLDTLNITHGRYYGFIRKGGVMSGAITTPISGSCGIMYLVGSVSTEWAPVMRLDPHYTAVNPYTNEATVLNLYPTWYV